MNAVTEVRGGGGVRFPCTGHGAPLGDAEREIGFFLAPTFSMLSLVAAVEPLRIANRFTRRALYGWRLLSVDGQPVVATDGLSMEVTGSIGRQQRLPTVIVCGPYDPRSYCDERVFAWLRGLASAGAQLGGLETGSYVLARARVLDRHRCTIHWENAAGFREAFPTLEVTTELFEFDRQRFSCGGGTAALDMMLHLIALDHGRELATAVSDACLHAGIRPPRAPQRMDLRHRLGVAHPRLLRCVALMQEHIEEPLSPTAIAARVGLSRRQLERLFKGYLETTPSAYYMRLRLARGRDLLCQTSMPVIDVAVACGFSSPGHFSHRFRDCYGESPRDARRSG